MLTYEESADADAASARWELARLLHQRVLHGVIPVDSCRPRHSFSKLHVARGRRRENRRLTQQEEHEPDREKSSAERFGEMGISGLIDDAQ